MKQNRYNQEFKQTIVELYRCGTSVSDLNRKDVVSEVTIYNWIKALSPIKNSGGLTPTEIATISKRKYYPSEGGKNSNKGYDHIREKVLCTLNFYSYLENNPL